MIVRIFEPLAPAIQCNIIRRVLFANFLRGNFCRPDPQAVCGPVGVTRTWRNFPTRRARARAVWPIIKAIVQTRQTVDVATWLQPTDLICCNLIATNRLNMLQVATGLQPTYLICCNLFYISLLFRFSSPSKVIRGLSRPTVDSTRRGVYEC